MNNNYPIETLLRPPVEWWSAVISCSVSGIAAFMPSAMLMTPGVGYFAAICLLLFGIKRFREGYRVVKFQKNLKRLPYYAISSDDISVSYKKIFLGKGFKWNAIHTQRLLNCQQVGAEKYLRPGKCYQLARYLERVWENSKLFGKIVKLLSSQSVFNPVRSLPDVGGNPVLHGVELNEKDVWMNLSERVGHVVVFGTTRVGKTRFAEIQIAQDIKRGDTVIVFDPKGDADLLLRVYAEAQACGREDDVMIFHLGFPEHSVRYNPIGNFARITEVANRVTKQMPAEGESAAFKEFSWRFVNIVAETLVSLGRKVTYKEIKKYILNIEPLLNDYCKQWLSTVDPNWKTAVKEERNKIDIKDLPFHMRNRSKYMIALVEYIKKNHTSNSVIEGLCSMFDYDKTYFNKITASLIPLLEKLTTGQTTALISPDYEDLDDIRPMMDWMQVIRGKKIVYVGLDALSDSTVAAAVGSSMFSDLCSVAGQIYKYGISPESRDDKKQHSVCVYADEFNEIANDDVVTVLNKGGGAGFQLTLLTQTWSDVEARLGTQAKAEQIGGNLNTLICMRVQNESTARYLTNKLPQNVEVRSVTEVSSVTDSPRIGGHSDFTSSNEDRITKHEVPMLTAADLIQLPKGQAFCLIGGGQLWKIRIPLPIKSALDVPTHIAQMAGQMRNLYQALNQSGDEWWNKTINGKTPNVQFDMLDEEVKVMVKEMAKEIRIKNEARQRQEKEREE